ncbi:MAG: RICIN domain-containing protein [Steroidobacteraceae bacterium]
MIRSDPKPLWRDILIALTLVLAGFSATHPAHAQSVTSTIVAANSGMCVSVANSSPTSGALIVQTPCAGQSSSVWTFVRVGSGYHVIAQNSGMCLNVPHSSGTPGTQLIQYPCQPAALNDQWQLIVEAVGFHLVSVATGLCVSISGNSAASGARVVEWACQGSAVLNDQMIVQMPGIAAQIQPSSTEIVALSSGQCVAVSNASQSPSAVLVQAVCDDKSDKTWVLSRIGSNYHLVSKLSGLCLNVPGASTIQATQLIQSTCQGSAGTSDQWQLVPVGTSYHIISASSGQCVNIAKNSQSPGAPIIQYPCQPATTLNDQFDLFTPSAVATTLNSTWTDVIALPVNPIGVANLPSGKLLMWSAYAPYSFESDINTAAGQTYTGSFDPASGTSTKVLVTVTGADLFCPGTAVLPNGTILINGGSSSPKTSLYDPIADAWSSAASMNIPRGYEGDTLLSTGDVFTLGGSWSGGRGNKTAEIWKSATGWAVLSGVPETNVIGPDPQGVYRGDNHLWLFATSNGAVFHAGPSAQMNWITTAGAGTITSAGNRGSDPFSINGNAVLYDIGKILKVGGSRSYNQDASTPTYATNSAYIIDITAGPKQPVKLTQLNGMTYRRAFANAVVLPDGEVVIVGGQTLPQPFTDTDGVLVPEIWNPRTQQFNMLVPMQVPRTYHSTAILLPDARVFVGGGGQCGVGCPNNHLDAQILSPPYLFNADGSAAVRPVISSAPPTAQRGSSISITTQNVVTEFALLRLSATTHTVNNDQRRVPLSISAASATTYTLTIPADPGIALPGYYMLFALDAKGVPSVGVTVRVP